MALRTDLIGNGMPAELTKRLGTNPPLAVTAAGSTNADATAIKKQTDFINLTATGSDGIILPSDADLMHPYFVYNLSGSTGKVYPPALGTLNGGTATTGSLSITTLKVVMFMRYSSTGWIYITTA